MNDVRRASASDVRAVRGRGFLSAALVTLTLGGLAGFAPAAGAARSAPGRRLRRRRRRTRSLHHQQRLAVNDASGDVVADVVSDQISVYQPWPISRPAHGFGAGVLNDPFGIAIDQVRRLSLHISDAGNSQIVEYVSNGIHRRRPSRSTARSRARHAAARRRRSPASPRRWRSIRRRKLLVARSTPIVVKRFAASGAFDGVLVRWLWRRWRCPCRPTRSASTRRATYSSSTRPAIWPRVPTAALCALRRRGWL